MKIIQKSVLFALAAASSLTAQEMNMEWGERVLKLEPANAERGQLFNDGNYAMFIHWGLFSQLANRYEGKTYYGIGEWLMNRRMANIPVEEYKKIPAQFNPAQFDPQAIAQLAKDAGMKYVVITAKHHDGFAMYDSAVSDFDIVDQTPYGKDPMRALADACRALGLGFGFYYSHVKDWTAPGGGEGPKTNPDGSPASFDDYFHAKALPQVEELVTNYGPLDLIWFDTPGSLAEDYADQFVDMVRKHQPKALINSRVGAGRGDYQSLGDMEVPHNNVPGMWETVDTTNDSWGYAWYDHNWKTPEQITERLISTVARGGTYMLNIGPRSDGSVPELAAKALRRSGQWIQQYPYVVYGTDASPWGNPLPWGDVTVKDNRLFLSVFDLPGDHTLNLPGLTNDVRSAKLIDGADRIPLQLTRENGWTRITLPLSMQETLVPVVEVVLEGSPKLADGWLALYDSAQSTEAKLMGIDPSIETTLLADFAKVHDAKKSKSGWMEKFGEWKHVVQVADFGDEGRATWEIDVLEPGHYQVDLTYRGPGRIIWRVEVGGGATIQNEQNASHNYQRFPMGWVHFPEAGRHTLHVSAVDDSGRPKQIRGDEPRSLKAAHLKRIEF
jgi:alpha-L-fucosidase